MIMMITMSMMIMIMINYVFRGNIMRVKLNNNLCKIPIIVKNIQMIETIKSTQMKSILKIMISKHKKLIYFTIILVNIMTMRIIKIQNDKIIKTKGQKMMKIFHVSRNYKVRNSKMNTTKITIILMNSVIILKQNIRKRANKMSINRKSKLRLQLMNTKKIIKT